VAAEAENEDTDVPVRPITRNIETEEEPFRITNVLQGAKKGVFTLDLLISKAHGVACLSI
jgi:hypothetical protein